MLNWAIITSRIASLLADAVKTKFIAKDGGQKCSPCILNAFMMDAEIEMGVQGLLRTLIKVQIESVSVSVISEV